MPADFGRARELVAELVGVGDDSGDGAEALGREGEGARRGDQRAVGAVPAQAAGQLEGEGLHVGAEFVAATRPDGED